MQKLLEPKNTKAPAGMIKDALLKKLQTSQYGYKFTSFLQFVYKAIFRHKVGPKLQHTIFLAFINQWTVWDSHFFPSVTPQILVKIMAWQKECEPPTIHLSICTKKLTVGVWVPYFLSGNTTHIFKLLNCLKGAKLLKWPCIREWINVFIMVCRTY